MALLTGWSSKNGEPSSLGQPPLRQNTFRLDARGIRRDVSLSRGLPFMSEAFLAQSDSPEAPLKYLLGDLGGWPSGRYYRWRGGAWELVSQGQACRPALWDGHLLSLCSGAAGPDGPQRALRALRASGLKAPEHESDVVFQEMTVSPLGELMVLGLEPIADSDKGRRFIDYWALGTVQGQSVALPTWCADADCEVRALSGRDIVSWSGKHLATFAGHAWREEPLTKEIECAEVGAGGRVILMGEGRTLLSDPGTSEAPRSYVEIQGPSVPLRPDQACPVCAVGPGSEADALCLLPERSGRRLHRLRGKTWQVLGHGNVAELDSDSQGNFLGYYADTPSMLYRPSGDIPLPSVHSISGAAFSANGEVLVGSDSGALLHRGGAWHKLVLPEKNASGQPREYFVSSVAFSPDGHPIVSAIDTRDNGERTFGLFLETPPMLPVLELDARTGARPRGWLP